VQKEIRILVVEDVAADVVLMHHELRRSGVEFRTKRVETKEDFLHELTHHVPDLILCDNGLATFDAFTALAVARDKCPDVPCIFIAGSGGAERAEEALKNGATDYVLKSQLFNLGSAVKRALALSEERKRREQVEAGRAVVSRQTAS